MSRPAAGEFGVTCDLAFNILGHERSKVNVDGQPVLSRHVGDGKLDVGPDTRPRSVWRRQAACKLSMY
jgi:hypothetical protein